MQQPLMTEKSSRNFRLAAPVVELIGRLEDHLGLSGTSVVEMLSRQALREEVPAPGDTFRRWHDNAGLTSSWSRYLSQDALDAIVFLAGRWDHSQSDTLEYLVWLRARQEGLI